MRPRIAHAIRWTVDEWKRVRRRARIEGRTPSEVVRDAVAWYLDLAEGGFEPESFTLADLRAALRAINQRSKPTAAAQTEIDK